MTKPKPIQCPECGSQRIWRDGWRYPSGDGAIPIQRFICRNCGCRFDETYIHKSGANHRNLPPHKSHESGKKQNEASLLAREKILQSRARQRAAGTTTKAEIKGKLVEFVWYMKKQGYAESTIRSRMKLVRRLVNLGADLYDPESVKEVIAKQSWCEGRKSNACDAYTSFLKMLGGTWNRPSYKSIPKLPFIPQESEIDQLIAGCKYCVAPLHDTLFEDAAVFLTIFYKLLIGENSSPWIAFRNTIVGLPQSLPKLSGAWSFYDQGEKCLIEE